MSLTLTAILFQIKLIVTSACTCKQFEKYIDRNIKNMKNQFYHIIAFLTFHLCFLRNIITVIAVAKLKSHLKSLKAITNIQEPAEYNQKQ